MKSAKAERSKHAAILEFQECPACGRVHFDALRVGGKIIATGAEAQRRFSALEDGQPVQPTPPERAPDPNANPNWRPSAERPPATQLIRVEYRRGGYYIAHGSFFDTVWDLICRWHRYDNSRDLREATEALKGRAPGLITPEWLLEPADRATRPPIPAIPEPPRYEPSLPPVGGNFSFAF